jgi:hypothetical protein
MRFAENVGEMVRRGAMAWQTSTPLEAICVCRPALVLQVDVGVFEQFICSEP